MNVREIVVESLSRVAFHYTNVFSALKILQSGEFELSSALGSIEEKTMPPGHYYFLSTTRTSHGGYHDFVGNTAVLFKLDGNWFNQRYRSRPYDYWGNRDPAKEHHRTHEAEDRVFSREPTMPIDGVTEVHVLLKPETENETKLRVRQLLLTAKTRNIDTFLYDDETHWKNRDQRNTVDVKQLSGQLVKPVVKPNKFPEARRVGYLSPWVELIYSDKKSTLSKEANQIAYGLKYTYDKQDITRGLNTEFSNARKPETGGRSGETRKQAIRIIRFMRRNNFSTIKELVEFLAAKWKDIR